MRKLTGTEQEIVNNVRQIGDLVVQGRHLTHWADQVVSEAARPWSQSMRRLRQAAVDWKAKEKEACLTLESAQDQQRAAEEIITDLRSKITEMFEMPR